MKSIIFITIIFLLSAMRPAHVYAQDSTDIKKVEDQTNKKGKQHGGNGFVDLDGDGFNDNAPDHDGDGIPNGLDPDYQGPGKANHFIDLDGDGIDDNLMSPMNDRQSQEIGVGPQNGKMGGQSEEGMPQHGSGNKGKRKRGNGNN